jgi:pyruvate formate lyase activating enzyme
LNRITPVETLEKVRRRALEEGLNYVYIGNVQGHTGENTYCPRCGLLLVDRHGFKILGYAITGDGLCPKCGEEVLIVGKPTLVRGNS